MTLRSETAVVLAFSQILLFGQQPPTLPPGFVRAPEPNQQRQAPAPAQTPAAQTPAQAPAQPGAAAAKPQTTAPAAVPTIAPSPAGGLNLQNASLTEVIDILARQLKINYILDPRVKGGVTINTYGETKSIDNRALLDMILRINNAAMIQVGEIYRIVPLTDVQKLPLAPEINGKAIPEDDRTMLNLMFLKFVTVEELAKVLDQFLGEGAKMWSYAPANLLMIQDSRRNMHRLLQLISLFDNDAFANQRVRLFEIKNGRPSDLAKEMDGIMKSISLNEKTSPVKFLPIDRINTLVAVAPNAGAFKEVENWLSKLDIEVESSSGTVGNYVYRVRYGCAPTIAMALMSLYSNNPYMMGMMGMMGMTGSTGCGGSGANSGVGGGYGMQGGMGMAGGMGMYGGYGMPGGGMYGGYGMPLPAYGSAYGSPATPGLTAPVAPGFTQSAGAATTGQNLTGQYLGAPPPGAPQGPQTPRIVPNPFDNSLLIQGTRQEYESILKLLRDIDVPPRQVLIEAKIYEVTLTGDLRYGVQAYLTAKGADIKDVTRPNTRALLGNSSAGGINLSVGTLVGASRELLSLIQASDFRSKTRVVSAPSVIATDSVAASINVGDEVPTLSAQAVTGAQQGGTSLFANNIQSRSSGTTLNITARVNPSGIVTLMINQEVSTPVPPDPGAAIQSPSFSKRSVQTQVTVQDGDTIAIGGIINENHGYSTSGIPFLNRIPILGAAFGGKAYQDGRTELIVFFTPKVIYDSNNLNEASDELKSRVKKLSRYMKDEL